MNVPLSGNYSDPMHGFMQTNKLLNDSLSERHQKPPHEAMYFTMEEFDRQLAALRNRYRNPNAIL